MLLITFESWVYGLFGRTGGRKYHVDELELDKSKKYAIVMGNEVKGVQQEVINHSDGCIEIPQYGTKHSLNVSVTTGIVIWDLFKNFVDSLKPY